MQCGTEGRNKLWDAENDSEHENSSKQDDLSALECKEIVSGKAYYEYTHAATPRPFQPCNHGFSHRWLGNYRIISILRPTVLNSFKHSFRDKSQQMIEIFTENIVYILYFFLYRIPTTPNQYCQSLSENHFCENAS